jgi:ABC-type multidrug transport system ATPase subunit
MLEWDGLYLNLTGLENVVYWAEIYGQNKVEANKNAVDAIQKVKLLDWADTLVSKYSHGMKKRLSFARAIINDPDILVLDEPTSGIDLESRILIRDLMRNFIKKGKTVFFSSHDLEEVQKISSSLSILNKGNIIFNGILEELIKIFGQVEIYIQLKTPEDATALIKNFENNVTNIKINGSILSFIPNEGYKPDLENENIISSWTSESSLEDAYLNAISSTKEDKI